MSVYHFNFEEDLEEYETEWKQYVKHTELKSELLQVLKRESIYHSSESAAKGTLISASTVPHHRRNKKVKQSTKILIDYEKIVKKSSDLHNSGKSNQ